MQNYPNLIIWLVQINHCCTMSSYIWWPGLSGGNTLPGCQRVKAMLHSGRAAARWKKIEPPRCTFPRCTADNTSVGGEESGAQPRAAGEIFICGPAGCFVIDGCFPGGLRGGGEQLALHLTPCRMVEVTVQVRPDKWPLAQSPTHARAREHVQVRHTHLNQGQVLERQRSISEISLRRIQPPRHGTRYMIKRS